jgi:hypothetical protein
MPKPAKWTMKNAPPGSRPMGRLNSKELDPTENQAAVGATKTKIIFQGIFNVDIASRVGTVIQIAFWILIV